MSVNQIPTVAIKLVRRVLDKDKPAELVHHFVLTRVGGEILLEAGFFDLVELKEAIDSSVTGDEGAATLTIRHRLLLTREVLEQLSAAVTQILAGFDASVSKETNP